MNENQRDEMLRTINSKLDDNTRKTEKLEKLFEAFPGGDMEGHRRYHQSVIEWRELRNNVIKESLVQVGKAGMLGSAGWLLYALWQYVKITVKQ